MNSAVRSRRLILLLSCICMILTYAISTFYGFTLRFSTNPSDSYRQRPECHCRRSELPPLSSQSDSTPSKSRSSLCSLYSTRRGSHQRVIAISLFGPKENKMFQLNRSLTFLEDLMTDLDKIYPDRFILRIYHDDTINAKDVICPIECTHDNVDFCNITEKKFIPPKIWRFIPAGDPLVDIMMSRDLDSAFTSRERDAVNVWLASNKSFHAMRDHPMHGVPMLGGMWGFRPPLSPEISRMIHEKIHKPELVGKYGGRGDQTFLSNEVWPQAKSSIIVHDSFLCTNGYGQKPDPFPTERPSANQTNCFVGCVRPCCGQGKMPFGECPMKCRPADHPEWKYC